MQGNLLSVHALRTLINVGAALLLALLLGCRDWQGAHHTTELQKSSQWLSLREQLHITVPKACCETLKRSQTVGSKFLTFDN